MRRSMPAVIQRTGVKALRVARTRLPVYCTQDSLLAGNRNKDEGFPGSVGDTRIGPRACRPAHGLADGSRCESS